MRAFIDVDVQAYLQRIMDVNTLYFKSDFEYDIQTLKDAAINQLNKHFLWLSRESGTYIFPERNVYVEPSSGNHTWKSYLSHPQEIKSFYVEVKNVRDGKPIGNLIELDYPAHCDYVSKMALRADLVKVSFVDGNIRSFGLNEFEENKASITAKYGNFYRYVNDTTQDMDTLLYHVRSERNTLIEPYDFERYMKELLQEPFLRLGYQQNDYFRLSQWDAKNCFEKGVAVYIFEKSAPCQQISNWHDVETMHYGDEHIIAIRQQDKAIFEYLKPENAEHPKLFSLQELYRLQSYLTYVGKTFDFTALENHDLQNMLSKITILTNAVNQNPSLEGERTQEQCDIAEPEPES